MAWGSACLRALRDHVRHKDSRRDLKKPGGEEAPSGLGTTGASFPEALGQPYSSPLCLELNGTHTQLGYRTWYLQTRHRVLLTEAGHEYSYEVGTDHGSRTELLQRSLRSCQVVES